MTTDQPDQPSVITQAIDEITRIYTGFDGGWSALNASPMEEEGLRLIIARELPKVALRLARKRGHSITDPEAKTGERTLDDLPDGPAPGQLLPPFLSPEGTTVIYGPGNVGKGMLSVHFCLELTAADPDLHIMVIDYEHHEHEWGRRARAMGATDDQMKRIHYRAPFADDWTAPRGALIDVAPYLRADCDKLHIGLIVIDSYTTATTTGDEMGGKDAAQEFYAGISAINRPALVLAHVASGGEKWPKKPFGSIFVHNLARETWAAENVATEDIPWDPKTDKYQPTVLALELRNRKMNNGPRPDDQFITFSFDGNGNIDVTTSKPNKGTVGDWAFEALRRGKKPMTTSDIAKTILEDRNEKPDTDTIRKALNRDTKRFVRDPNSTTKWMLTAKSGDDEQTLAR